jgi:TRAP-type mannitol/chloroaromatic compound transport system permease small subunit
MTALRAFVTWVDAFNRRVGRVAMYGIFVLMGILLWSTISKATDTPSLWTLEAAQFAMVGYYVLGGPYSIQMGANVRMDLFYGELSDWRKAQVDALTVLFLIAFLVVLLWGAVGSLAYSLGHFGSDPLAFLAGLAVGLEETGFLERSPTAWRPPLWPIKLVMTVGIVLMLLQALSELGKDVLLLAGKPFDTLPPEEAS